LVASFGTTAIVYVLAAFVDEAEPALGAAGLLHALRVRPSTNVALSIAPIKRPCFMHFSFVV
jgi:hypothetical protein